MTSLFTSPFLEIHLHEVQSVNISLESDHGNLAGHSPQTLSFHGRLHTLHTLRDCALTLAGMLAVAQTNGTLVCLLPPDLTLILNKLKKNNMQLNTVKQKSKLRLWKWKLL